MKLFNSIIKKFDASMIETGAYPEIFRGRGFELFWYGRENLGGF